MRACAGAADACRLTATRRRGGACALRSAWRQRDATAVVVARPDNSRVTSQRRAPCAAAQQPPPPLRNVRAGVALVGGSSVLYVGLAGVAEGVARLGGAPSVLPALFAAPPLLPALAFTAPLCLSLAAAMAAADAGVPSCVELKTFFSRSITPLITALPTPALALLAAAAGLGEEAMFRGALLPLASAAAAAAGADAATSAALALAATSVLFGALHAVTPLYFAWATAAGALFGWEWYATGGSLSACALTHGLYDFIAFVVIARTWGAAPADGGKAAGGDELQNKE